MAAFGLSSQSRYQRKKHGESKTEKLSLVKSLLAEDLTQEINLSL